MAAPAVIVVPTAGRPAYLDVALASIAPQALAAGAEMLVVDDGPDEASAQVAARHGARYIAHEHRRGPNAARNTAIAHSDAELLCFVDDDIAAHDGWLEALLAAHESEPEDVAAIGGPILARFEGVSRRVCGREGPPVTHLDLGPEDRDCDHCWSANLALRRSWIERVGPFDDEVSIYGDEEEWQDRARAAGGRIRYVASAGVDHRRAGEDARPRPLMRAAYHRGLASRRFDRLNGRSPSLTSELRVLAGCALHGPLRRCANGPVMTAHSLGRLRAAWGERLGLDAPPARAGEDFLSGRSGITTGKVALLLHATDLWLDARALPRRRVRRRAARATPRQRVLVLALERTDVPNILAAALSEIDRGAHDVTVSTAVVELGRGKFDHLNALLAAHDLDHFDWVIALDDDVALPSGFLDTFLAAAQAGDLQIAQPAHRRHSHAAWPVTVRVPGADWRETTFVEIGPVTAFSRQAAGALLPFPANAGMGWGLDCLWGADAAQLGWKIGVVDATPIAHTMRQTAGGYRREQAAAEAGRLLEGRDYVRRHEARTLSYHRFGER